VAELKDGAVNTFEVTPQDAGLPEANLSDLKGGDAETNAAALRALLDGAPGAYRDVVLFGSAAALIVAGKAETLREGVIIAAEAVDSGRARAALDKLVAVTNATS
jgi:anthranilate phosphoribosyltransferase